MAQPFNEENWLYYLLSLVQIPERLSASKTGVEYLEGTILSTCAERPPSPLYAQPCPLSPGRPRAGLAET